MSKYNRMPRKNNYVKKAKDACALSFDDIVQKTNPDEDVTEHFEDGDFVLGDDVSIVQVTPKLDADEIVGALFDPDIEAEDMVDLGPKMVTSDWFMDRYQDLLDRATTGENPSEIVYDLALRFATFFDGDIHAFEFASAAFSKKIQEFQIPCAIEESVQYDGMNFPLLAPYEVMVYRPK